MQDQIDAMVKRMERIEKHHTQFKAALDANTAMTKQIEANTNELIQFFNTGKSGLKVAMFLGRGLKGFMAFLVAVVALWAAAKSVWSQIS